MTWKPALLRPRAPKEEVPVATVPLLQNQPLPADGPTNVTEAKQMGLLSAGTPITAPLAPMSGSIPGKSGDFVTTVLKDFWESPTIKKLRNAVVAAVTAALGIVMAQIVIAKGDMWSVNWHVTINAAVALFAFTLASGYGAWLKTHDNDPVKQGTDKKADEK